VLTLPNFLTLLRIVAIPIFLVFLVSGNYAPAFILFLAAGVTDTVDGAVARLTDSRSDLGAFLDPLADKLLLLSSFIVLGSSGAIAPWLVVVVISRDVIVVLGYLVLYLVHEESMAIDPTRLGKVNTFFELFTVGFALMSLARPVLPMAVPNLVLQTVTAASAAASGVHYVYRGLLWHQRQANTGG
jgi:cardiolipin synthase (CMP-forming)